MTVLDYLKTEGAWTHHAIHARGASFHVVIAGDDTTRPTLVLLSDFPLHWWSWRDQIVDLCRAGYRVLAVDLRGQGGSDLQPGAVELDELARDVIAICDATGTTTFTVVGSGLGGSVAWTVAHLDPPGLRSVVAICAPHPLTKYPRSSSPASAASSADRELGVPLRRSRRLSDGSLVRQVLTTWCAPRSVEHMSEVAPIYAAPLHRRVAANAALETQKAARHPSSSTKEVLSTPVAVPVWSVRGKEDRRVPTSAYNADVTHARGPVTHVEIATSGHFPNEERPDELTALLTDHMRQVYGAAS